MKSIYKLCEGDAVIYDRNTCMLLLPIDENVPSLHSEIAEELYLASARGVRSNVKGVLRNEIIE